jgi:putative tricarboxylic transport membrane protein
MVWWNMRIRSPRDFWAGLIFIAVAAGFIYVASGYRYGTAQRMGPGFFPIYVAGFLGFLGLCITLRSFVLNGDAIDRIGVRQILVTLVAVVLFAIALAYFGLVAAILVLVLVGAFADANSKPLEVMALAIFLSAFSVGVFVYLLGLPLQVWPEGLL